MNTVIKAILFSIFAFVGLSLGPMVPAGGVDSIQAAVAAGPRLPLYFIPNRGQKDGRALYYAALGPTTLWLARDGIVFDRADPNPDRGERKSLDRDVTKLVFKDSSPGCEIVPVDPADHAVSYFNGSGPEDWITGLPTSLGVLYKNVYDRIDLKVYGSGPDVEYDWIVRPGGDPGRIRIAFEGARRTRLDGDLVVETARGVATHRRPFAFQDESGLRNSIEAGFCERAPGEFGITVGPYDRTRNLCIDPYAIGYSTYLGGRGYDFPTGIAALPSGEIILTGQTLSLDFPVLVGSRRFTGALRNDAFVVKIASDGRSLVYSAFFPMTDGYSADLNVDETGTATIVGNTTNSKLPVKNAFQPKHGGGYYDGFIIQLDPNGKSLVFSTYFGGSGYDFIAGIQRDAQGAVVLAGYTTSRNLPMVQPIQNRLAGNEDAFIAKLSRDGRGLVYSTYLGGSNADRPSDLAVDKAGAAYVIGSTDSANFPVAKAYQKFKKGRKDVFIAKIAPDGRRLQYATYLGGTSYDYAEACAVNNAGALVLVGETLGTFPLKKALRTTRNAMEGFVTKLSPDGQSLVFSTYFGGGGSDYINGLGLDDKGQIWLSGSTTSPDFPLKKALQKKKRGAGDAFLSLLSDDGQSLAFSTFLGGSYNDQANALFFGSRSRLYLGGVTNSLDFPTVRPLQENLKGDSDGFVVRLDLPTRQTRHQ